MLCKNSYFVGQNSEITMKTFALVLLIALFACTSWSYIANAQHCSGDCTSSALCASSSNNTSCRCSYLACKIVDKCGGGCLTNSQCANWAGGDPKCVCTWWFECEMEHKLKDPGYLPFLKIAAMAKNNKSFKELQEANREHELHEQ